MCGARERSLVPSEVSRLENAACTVARSAFVPHVPNRRLFFASVAGLAKAVFGWKHKIPTVDALRPLNRALKRCTWPHNSASPHLALLLRGHHVDFECKLMINTMSFWFKKKLHGIPLPAWASAGRQKLILNTMLLNVGWKVTSPWTWRHEFSRESFSLLPNVSDHSSLPEFQHVLRESRRQQLFAQWKATTRIDADLCSNVRYNAKRCQHARKLAFQSAHAFAVMSGAFVSPMHVSARFLNNPQTRDRVPHAYAFCTHCDDHANDFDHWNWHCAKMIASGRPAIPRDPLQKRLGWPLPKMTLKCQDILDHLCDRRDAAISWRIHHRM